MNILVVAEHSDGQLRQATLSAMTFARALQETSPGEVATLVLGHDIEPILTQAAEYTDVLGADTEAFEALLAGPAAQVIADVVRQHKFDVIVAASTSQTKDIVTRAAGLLGGRMASDVVGHRFCDGRLELDRPIFAGAAIATITIEGSPQIITIRSSAYPPAEPLMSRGEVTSVAVDGAALPHNVRFDSAQCKSSSRPDVTEARVVVSGGRAIKNSEDFERLVGGLADAMQGATGSSRALVDAGIAANELQVGQTGKIVAPEIYVALGISGAVQHLAGMKNSQTIVAINNDPDAPIIGIADYVLVADIYEAVPELISKLSAAEATVAT